jgi:hypothetical protein
MLPTPPTQFVEPGTAVQFDPRWMGLVPNQPQGWEELYRSVTADFQQFDFRPVGDTEFMRGCNGCAPWTAELTAYAPGTFDPTTARTGQPVSVNGTDDGYFRPADDSEDATVSWQYADDAWATASGLTEMTSGLDVLVVLARTLRPGERTPIRFPLSLANLPADMPLAQVDVDTHTDMPTAIDYGTRIDFAPCGLTATMESPGCRTAGRSLSVRIAACDYRAPSGGAEQTTVPVKVGGRDGVMNETIQKVSVQVQPGMLVEFDVGGLAETLVRDILATVAWAPDPGDEATWPEVADWTE